MRLLISDANILIDMEAGALMETLFRLPMQLCIPEFEYAWVANGDEIYLMATGMLESVQKATNVPELKVLKTFKGTDADGLKFRHPLLDRLSPVVLADYVTLEAGTGCVHTARPDMARMTLKPA